MRRNHIIISIFMTQNYKINKIAVRRTDVGKFVSDVTDRLKPCLCVIPYNLYVCALFVCNNWERLYGKIAGNKFLVNTTSIGNTVLCIVCMCVKHGVISVIKLQQIKSGVNSVRNNLLRWEKTMVNDFIHTNS